MSDVGKALALSLVGFGVAVSLQALVIGEVAVHIVERLADVATRT